MVSIYQALAFIVAVCATGCANDFANKEPTQQDMLETPAIDLAKDYLAAEISLGGVQRLVEAGAFGGSGARFVLKIRGEAIDKDNVDEYLAKYQKQLSLYEEAIKQRGIAHIAGVYKGEATKSYSKSNSLLAAAIQWLGTENLTMPRESMEQAL